MTRKECRSRSSSCTMRVADLRVGIVRRVDVVIRVQVVLMHDATDAVRDGNGLIVVDCSAKGGVRVVPRASVLLFNELHEMRLIINRHQRAYSELAVLLVLWMIPSTHGGRQVGLKDRSVKHASIPGLQIGAVTDMGCGICRSAEKKYTPENNMCLRPREGPADDAERAERRELVSILESLTPLETNLIRPAVPIVGVRTLKSQQLGYSRWVGGCVCVCWKLSTTFCIGWPVKQGTFQDGTLWFQLGEHKPRSFYPLVTVKEQEWEAMPYTWACPMRQSIPLPNEGATVGTAHVIGALPISDPDSLRRV